MSQVPALKKGMEFALLPHSPSIISLGRLCMLSGFSLHWPTSKAPYLLDPSGQRIDLVVDNFVPYISSAQLDTVGVNGRTPVSTSSSSLTASVTAGVHPMPDTANDVAAGAGLSNLSSGSSEDPSPLPPPPAPWGVEGHEESDCDSVESYEEMLSNPDMSEREKELRLQARSLAHLMMHSPKNKFCVY